MTDHQRAQRRVDTVFDIFAHHRRRYALCTLRMHEEPMTLADLAEEVAIQENEAPITEISAEEVKRVYLSLYHTHVPKLADAEFVQYDQELDLVTLSPRVERVEEYQKLLTVE